MKQLQKVVHYFGIDVSKTTANVAILVDNSIVKQFKVATDRGGFQTLSDELNSFKSPLIIFEATVTAITGISSA